MSPWKGWIALVLNKHQIAPDDYPDAVYIGRGSPWGNPFRIGVDGTRDEVCDRFEREILPTLDLEPIRGKDLVCFCAPSRCHGHSIVRALYGNAIDAVRDDLAVTARDRGYGNDRK